MSVFTPEHKKALELRMIAAVISGLEQDQLEIHDLQPLANTVLKRIDQVEDHDQLVDFLEDLAKRWSVFQPILESERLSKHVNH